MAKRKRLTPARTNVHAGAAFPPAPTSGPAHSLAAATPGRPPIAQVAGEAAAVSALSSLSSEWDLARAEGRLVISLPLEEVVADHLVRDRVALDEEAMNELKQSLKSRGQQTPVEVRELEDGRYGLISGWRRLTALRSLLEETGEARFTVVQALVRRPDDLAASYVAMVEENEIRADLSFYERARIVVKALEAGAYETEKDALQSLFSAASYARRSKIKSFLGLVRELDGYLRFPARVSERAGLTLAKVLAEDPEAGPRLRRALDAADAVDAEAEAAVLTRNLTAEKRRNRVENVPAEDTAQDGTRTTDAAHVQVSFEPGRISLTGQGIDGAFQRRLKAWLRAEGMDLSRAKGS